MKSISRTIHVPCDIAKSVLYWDMRWGLRRSCMGVYGTCNRGEFPLAHGHRSIISRLGDIVSRSPRECKGFRRNGAGGVEPRPYEGQYTQPQNHHRTRTRTPESDITLRRQAEPQTQNAHKPNVKRKRFLRETAFLLSYFLPTFLSTQKSRSPQRNERSEPQAHKKQFTQFNRTN